MTDYNLLFNPSEPNIRRKINKVRALIKSRGIIYREHRFAFQLKMKAAETTGFMVDVFRVPGLKTAQLKPNA